MVRAVVRFDPSDGSIIESLNVDSVTKNGTGDYTVNYVDTFSDIPFFPVVSVADTSGNILSPVISEVRGGSSGSWTTSIAVTGAEVVLGVLTFTGPTDPTDEVILICE